MEEDNIVNVTDNCVLTDDQNTVTVIVPVVRCWWVIGRYPGFIGVSSDGNGKMYR